MAKLTDDVKLFIVIGLARHLTPSQVADAVKEEFGLVVDRMQVQVYDPTKAQGKALSQKLRDIFYKVREEFINEASKVPIALRNYRFQTMQLVLNRALERKNDVLALSVLEQAAKEEGGHYYRSGITKPSDSPNPMEEFMRQLNEINGSSIPIAHDVEGEVIESKMEKQEPEKSETEPDAVPTKKPRKLVGRD